MSLAVAEPAYIAIPVVQAIVLGVVQGLGEFLPISSSAHLILTPWFMGWKDPGLTFDVALHVGTLLAVLVFYGRDWIKLLTAGVGIGKNADDRRLFWQLVAGTVPGAILGVLLEKKAEHAFRHPLILACTMAGMGIVLFLCDRAGRKTRTVQTLSLIEVLGIGFAQGLAVVPGVSRAGATMSLALLLGLKREEAARFSFLLSTPIIAGAAALKMRHMLHHAPQPDLVAGTLAAAVVGMIAIGFLINYLRKGSFTPFVVYRLLLAGAIVAWFFSGHPAIS